MHKCVSKNLPSTTAMVAMIIGGGMPIIATRIGPILMLI
jgi:hypothetical protein